ncbi:lipid-A-disaccharide synthase [Verminephrobacter aporrectodeae subsp. tuberculatae]|uniref:lipid-A-disaccharide synthase n=2 Tax=Verminephrobacter aporrectodeae TaxID=1110389 RepID=UPI002238186A|nr:lipid-A-disaccharide synthase [Verminephrobacter aporrectodeae]MCW5255713.1 lipid-A-disaccharide synthase [Verminephrobacter aporrectodeae subsp. tuberculatae]MCW8206402.1 lipid-A-disaccharide synthase [Verminephrobacter aporrectodeae subsp. tuberculatae]
MTAPPPRVAMVAGEASGDLLAALLLDGLQAHSPGLQSHGIGGPQMESRGFSAWWPSDRLAVHGYSLQVLRRLRELLGIRKQLRERLLADRPDVFIGVDAPDFNLSLEADLRAAGVRTVHFVCPSIWAWRADRVEKIRRSADHVLCVFPFEPELLAQHGIAATYVGHPLAGVIPMEPDRAAARARIGLRDADEVLAILPGSRESEIEYIAPLFFAAAALLRRTRPAIKLLVPALPALRERIVLAARSCGLAGAALEIVSGQSHSVLAACDAALVASGTATLEAALFKRPMVISYRMHPLSWQLMRRKQLQPWVGLPNILCRDFVVPELIQNAATPQALCAATLQWLDARRSAPQKITDLEQRFTALHASLQRNTSQLAADAICKIISNAA